MMESKSHTNSSGDIYWRLPDGTRHREDGPAVIGVDGYKEWWINGKPHRLDGPVFIRADGSQNWYKFGKLHRLDGPAFIGSSGRKDWWINDYHVSNKIQEWANEMNIDLDNLTDEDKVLIRIYWENYSE